MKYTNKLLYIQQTEDTYFNNKPTFPSTVCPGNNFTRTHCLLTTSTLLTIPLLKHLNEVNTNYLYSYYENLITVCIISKDHNIIQVLSYKFSPCDLCCKI